MWPLPVSANVLTAMMRVVALLAAFSVGAAVNGWRVERNWQTKELARIEAAEVSRTALEESNAKVISAYRTELDRARGRPARRVYTCPDASLPAAAGGAANPATAGDAGGPGADITDTLIECRAYTLQLTALIESVRGSPP